MSGISGYIIVFHANMTDILMGLTGHVRGEARYSVLGDNWLIFKLLWEVIRI
jgi:hypothetical protein